MSRGKEKTRPASPLADNLEPYRRLIELQKQMIELGERRARALNDCKRLREQVAREAAGTGRSRQYTFPPAGLSSFGGMLKRVIRLGSSSRRVNKRNAGLLDALRRLVAIHE